MIEAGALPRVDWLSFTRPGASWIDFEWAAQLVWLAAFSVRQWAGLLVLKAALFGACGVFAWRTLTLYRLPAAVRAIWLLAAALALLPANDLRPENFSLAFFAAEWWRLERERLGPVRARAGAAELAASAAFFAAWANLHAGFAYGLAALGLAAVIDRARRARFGALFAAGVAGTLLNPAGWRLYGVLLDHALGLARLSELIREYQAPSLLDPWLAPFWALLAAAFGVVLRRQWKGEMPLLHVAAIGLFGLSAGRHIRTAPYFVIVAAPSAALALGAPATRRAHGAAWAAALALLGYWGARIAPVLLERRAYVARYAPEGIARFLDREGPALAGRRMYHPVEWGGYLAYRLGPRYPVFADGRYLFHDLLGPVYEARQDPDAFQKLLDRYRIDLALLQADPKRIEVYARMKDGRTAAIERPAYLFFVPKARWALVYWDHMGMVFVRRSAFPARWIAAHEYRLFRPGDLEAAALLVRQGSARAQDLDAERARFTVEATRR